MTDVDNADSYRCDDREGCLDSVFATAQQALAVPDPPPPDGHAPNEGPILNGLVQIQDGVLPPFYNQWKCSQCGRDPADVKRNGCGYSQGCGRVATSTKCAACRATTAEDCYFSQDKPANCAFKTKGNSHE